MAVMLCQTWARMLQTWFDAFQEAGSPADFRFEPVDVAACMPEEHRDVATSFAAEHPVSKRLAEFGRLLPIRQP